MSSPRLFARLAAIVAGALLLLSASPAFAHWCNCLWVSGYNLVLRPASDTVTVPTSGAGTLEVFLQNNMGYPLYDFALTATATGYTVAATGGDPPKVTAGGKPYLMPGEKNKKVFSFTKSGGGSLPVQNIKFFVKFGETSAQRAAYGTSNDAVVIKKGDGTLAPAGLPGLGNAGGQAINLGSMAKVDFGTAATGVSELLDEYCLARGSFSSHTCSGTCDPGSGLPSNYDVEHLWSITHLGARKSAMTAAQVDGLRTALQCGWQDDQPVFKYTAAFVLGYLGDGGTTKAFLTNIAATATDATDKLVAKAALVVMGDNTFKSDVTGCVTGGTELAQDACAAALGIVDKNDQVVTDKLLARARWICPASCDAGDDPKPFYAAHLLEIVSWDRRGFAQNADDTGYPSYYNTVVDTTPPKAPASATCVAQDNAGTIRVSWPAVTLDTSGATESGVTYKVYSDSAGHAPCTHVGDSGCNYAHVNPVSGALYRDFPAQTGTSTFYYRVTAVDAANNESAFSVEANCKPKYTPVAHLTCTPSSGVVPPDLSVTCDGSASTDANGNADITDFSFKLDSAAAVGGAASSKAYTFTSAATHTVQLIVTDSTSLASAPVTATVSVSASASDSGVVHNPPVARTTGTTPVTGPAPLTVNFDGSASTGDTTLSYSWDFGDGSAPNTTQKPSHTYNAKGSYTATLTVTDQDAMTGSAFVSISVTGNSPPDVTYASASPASGSTPLVVTFNGSGVTDPEGDNVTLTWNFGDASAVSNAKTVDHTYSTAGSYNASLSAQDDGTPAVAPSTKAFTIIVSAPGQSPDCSAATVTPSSGAAPLAVHMDATGCTDPQGKTPLTFEWHIPVTPEVVLTTATADYTFPSPGTTTIHLIARNNASPPLPTQRDFPITVTGGGTTDGGGSSAAPDANSATSQISSGCGCSAATAGPGAVGLLLVALGLVRRRR